MLLFRYRGQIQSTAGARRSTALDNGAVCRGGQGGQVATGAGIAPEAWATVKMPTMICTRENRMVSLLIPQTATAPKLKVRPGVSETMCIPFLFGSFFGLWFCINVLLVANDSPNDISH
ncbi:hypothetical protein PNOK_0790600 [Pyrrhoderma noxium]|uniref:Uncharacterized protein n=1 Tax=Pyrrhoderma noxium TaxID=2282107 RepID=A0A286U9R4_9AGAM|nr:hypothetical protein PNOK_0790600 [Pyrrhoderma noxium]